MHNSDRCPWSQLCQCKCQVRWYLQMMKWSFSSEMIVTCGGFPTAGMSQPCGKQWHLIIFDTDDEGDNRFIVLVLIVGMNIFNGTKMTMLCRAESHWIYRHALFTPGLNQHAFDTWIAFGDSMGRSFSGRQRWFSWISFLKNVRCIMAMTLMRER